MGPYLEGALWAGTHGSLIYTIRAALTHSLPAGYYAEMDQYVWLETDEGEVDRLGKPDTFVGNGAGLANTHGPGGLLVAEPTAHTTLASPKKRKGNRYIRIMDQLDNRVITVIEILSPSNKKPGEDRDNYIAKRKEYLATGTSLVELDLLRSGDRIPLGKPAPPPADYYVLVSRADQFPKADIWGFSVREPIPVVPIPLKPGDQPIALSVRECLDRAYDDAGYGNRIDYSRPPSPTLQAADAVWAAELVKFWTKK